MNNKIMFVFLCYFLTPTVTNTNHTSTIIKDFKYQRELARLIFAIEKRDYRAVHEITTVPGLDDTYFNDDRMPITTARTIMYYTLGINLLQQEKPLDSLDLNATYKTLEILLQNNFPNLAKILIKFGLNLNTSDEFRNTLLMFAAFKQNKKCTNFLLENNADVNRVNNTGSTAIMYAVEQFNEQGSLINYWTEKIHDEIIKNLLQHGANPLIPRNDGLTPEKVTKFAHIRLLLLAGNTNDINLSLTNKTKAARKAARKELDRANRELQRMQENDKRVGISAFYEPGKSCTIC